MEAVLNCQSLTKNFGAKTALDHFSAAVYGGRITGLLGPNGSGKTTLIKLAAGLLTPTDGAVTVCGTAPGTQTKAHVAYLPDRMSLPNHLRVREAVEFFADFYVDFQEEKASALLSELKIQPDERIGTMSKGTREKLQLALVMSRAADLYLLDEPIGGVDPAARDRILDTIIRNYREEAALVISTHLIGDIEPVLDDVIMIQDGRPVLTGNVEELRETHGKSMDALFREVFKC
ncbi:MAG: ABC transporter ATP-binding protein [Subdoligranulum sp.]|nr:ABC transporter ATP-binding protein [Subdoligranulum sp.]MBD5101221.1 ABC transporter ATP-binding protein [Subdoligranulum sp.]